MTFIVTAYQIEQDENAHEPKIFKDENHFITEVGQHAKKPVNTLQEAVALYNEAHGYKHCLITKGDYQSSRQWSRGVIKAARSLGWFHSELDWLYRPALEE